MAGILLSFFCFGAIFCSTVALYYPFFDDRFPPNYISPVSQSIPMQESSFNQFSTCFYLNPSSFISDSQQIPMLSYLSGDISMPEIAIHFDLARQMTFLSVGGEKAELFSQVPQNNELIHVCLTWDGNLGLARAYVDGQMTGAARSLSTGYQIFGDGLWQIEQNDPYGGMFTQFQFWNRVISAEEVQKAPTCSVPGRVVSWVHPTMVYQESSEQTTLANVPSTSNGNSYPDYPKTSDLDREKFNEEFGVQVIKGKYAKNFPKQTKFSVCAWIYIEKNTDMEPIAMYDNENSYIFGVLFSINGTVTLQLGKGKEQEAAIIPNHNIIYDWQHYCFTWSRTDGKAQVFIDGDLQHVIRDFKKDYFLPAGSNLYIFQIQYGRIDEAQPVTGFALKVTDVNWWDYVISEENAAEVCSHSGSYPGNLINWKEDVLMFNSSWKDTRPPCRHRKFTAISPYDLNSGFGDGRTHLITATLTNAKFKDMTAFSFCYRYFNKWHADNVGTFISYEDSIYQKLISIGYRFNGARQIYFGVGTQEHVLRNSFDDDFFYNFCVTWSSETGQVSLYWGTNKISVSIDPVSKGYTLPGDGKLKIRQEQLSALIEKSPYQGFLYKVSDFYMWDRALSENEVANFYKCTSSVMPFIVDPDSSKWEIHDVGLPLCRRSTYTSPYDLKTGFGDGRSHLVTATLKNVVFPDLKAFTICFNLFNEKVHHNMEPIMYIHDDTKYMYYKYEHLDKDLLTFGIGKNSSVLLFGGYLAKVTAATCVTWESKTGRYARYDNYFGDYIHQTISNVNLPGNGMLKIIQEQRAPLNENFPKIGFAYKLSDFYMWDRELSKDEVRKFWDCPDNLAPFLVDPSTSKWDVKDTPL